MCKVEVLIFLFRMKLVIVCVLVNGYFILMYILNRKIFFFFKYWLEFKVLVLWREKVGFNNDG